MEANEDPEMRRNISSKTTNRHESPRVLSTSRPTYLVVWGKAMNSALDNLYDELLRHADQEIPREEITEAEKAKRFLEEKRLAVERLKEAR